jgi:hypothetical protein
MHASSRIEVHVVWHDGDDDPTTLHFSDVVSKGLSHRVERQGSVDEALDKFQTAHRFLLLLANPSVAFLATPLGMSLPPRKQLPYLWSAFKEGVGPLADRLPEYCFYSRHPPCAATGACAMP